MVKRLAQLYRSIQPPGEDECSNHRPFEGGQQACGKCHCINVKIDLISGQICYSHIFGFSISVIATNTPGQEPHVIRSHHGAPVVEPTIEELWFQQKSTTQISLPIRVHCDWSPKAVQKRVEPDFGCGILALYHPFENVEPEGKVECTVLELSRMLISYEDDKSLL